MNIQSTVVRTSVPENPLDEPIKTVRFSEQTEVLQQQVKQHQKHCGIIADIAKGLCEFSEQTGLSEKLEIDVASVKDVSVFVKHMSKQELLTEQQLPGLLARTNVSWPQVEPQQWGSFGEIKSGLNDLKLTLEEYILPGTAKADFNVAPRITLNFIDFANKGFKALETNPTDSSLLLKNSVVAGESLLKSVESIVKLDKNASATPKQFVKYGAAAIHCAKAWQSFSDSDSSLYRKTMDVLKGIASSVEALAGSFPSWQQVKHTAGVSMIAINTIDKAVTLTIGKEVSPQEAFLKSLDQPIRRPD